KPFIIIVSGPTAVGKTTFSIKLAQDLNSEIVNIDSVQAYKEFNIGSAKPTQEELSLAKHHMVDIYNPDERIDAKKYAKGAEEAINKVLSKGKIPILSGGTGLYLKAALETKMISNQSLSSFQLDHGFANSKYNFLILFLNRKRKNLYERINRRTQMMIDQGIIEETKSIMDKHGSDLQVFSSIGYSDVLKYINNEIDKEQLIESISQSTRRFAKRQMTFWRNEPIKRNWKVSPSNSTEYDFLDKTMKNEKSFLVFDYSYEQLLSKIKLELSSNKLKSHLWNLNQEKL
ncbi:UNVERIFIED_CONTAM: hypothetical protein GTU68_041779, partial [Idotea baltica]|nr:hypothetical protein [Idotea baltica]